jgi:hypothetical protein
MDEPQNGQRLPSILIRPEVMRDLKISANEYMVLETVFMLSALHGYCYKTLKPMANDLAINKTTCHYIIERLLSRGLLNKSAAGLTVSENYIKAAHIDDKPHPSSKIERKPVQKLNQRSKIEPSVQKLNQRSKTTPKYYNKNSNENKSTNVLVDLEKPKSTAKSYRVIFAELVQTLGFTSRVMPTNGRIRKLATRLKQFSYDDVLLAATNIGQDQFLQGDNPGGRRYGDIDYLLRSDEIIDKWRTRPQTSATDSRKEMLRRYNEAAH